MNTAAALVPNSADTSTPAFSRRHGLLIFLTLIFVTLALGAVALDYYIGTGAVALHKSEIYTLQTGALTLLLINFGMITYHVTGKLKKIDEEAELQMLDLRDLKTELHHVNNEFENTKADLDYSKSQLANTIFQLSNANLQFDIITGELDSAKRETDAIFANVRQGLFLLSPDGTIGAQTSEELKVIFQTSELARRNFLTLLRPLLPEKRHKTISDYFDLLFDARKNEKQLHKFNPLKRVELNFPSSEGGFRPKHVEFAFQRIIAGDTVSRVMVAVLDVTHRIKLEEQLRAGEMLREKQLELLFEILQVESTDLRRFIEDAEGALAKINGIFMETGSSNGGSPLHDKVQRVFRLAHNLKSEAAAVGLLLFEKIIHQVEDQLNDLRRNPALANEDLLTVLGSVANFQSQLKETSELIEKISGLRRSFGPTPEEPERGNEEAAVAAPNINPSSELKRCVEDLCSTIAARRGKKAQIQWQIQGYDPLPARHHKLLQNAIFQLARNSLVHGIELPDDRVRAGKDPCGCIKINIASVPGEDKVHITCRDDGAGLDVESIRTRALKEGLIQDSEGKSLSDNQIYALIFEPGFSTAAAVTEDAGRGVGLDVLRDEIVEQLHGEIHIEFAADRFCEFGITVPAA